MATELDKLRDELLLLPLDSRASLAHSLIASLDEEVEENVDELWLDEIRGVIRLLRAEPGFCDRQMKF